MKHRERGVTLVELLVVMFSLMVVMAMGFEILSRNGTSVSRGLSLNSSGDRLRLLLMMIQSDLASRSGRLGSVFPVEISSATATFSPELPLLRFQRVQDSSDEKTAVVEVFYSLEEDPPGSGRFAVVRTEDPDLSPGKSEKAESRILFHLGRTESLIFEKKTDSENGENSPVRLRIALQDSQFGGWVTERWILLVGEAP